MWGMNVSRIPLSQNPHAFWTLLAIQLGLAAALLIILRTKKLI
jgi:Mg2+ and Co2+ transporter CorA